MRLSLSLTWQSVAVILGLLALCGVIVWRSPESAGTIGAAVAALITGWLVPAPVKRTTPGGEEVGK